MYKLFGANFYMLGTKMILYIKQLRVFNIRYIIYRIEAYGHWSYHLHEFEPVIELFSSFYI